MNDTPGVRNIPGGASPLAATEAALTATASPLGRTATTHSEPLPRPRRRCTSKVALLAILFSALTAGHSSASFSPYVKVVDRTFASPAADCVASAGAHFRPDGKAQGEARVACTLRHAQTTVSVRLVRWNLFGEYWQGLAWGNYNYANSFGTGSAHVVSPPSEACGDTWWYTEVRAWVKTGTITREVWFRNEPQRYNPCAPM